MKKIMPNLKILKNRILLTRLTTENLPRWFYGSVIRKSSVTMQKHYYSGQDSWHASQILQNHFSIA